MKGHPVIRIIIASAVVCLCAGCGPKVESEQFDPMGAVGVTVQNQIKDALKKAGVTNDISAIVEMDKEWMVTLRPESKALEGDSRPIPDRAMIDKSTFSVRVVKPDARRPGK